MAPDAQRLGLTKTKPKLAMHARTLWTSGRVLWTGGSRMSRGAPVLKPRVYRPVVCGPPLAVCERCPLRLGRLATKEDSMTQGEWDALGIPMVWSIYKGNTTDKDLASWELDLTTDAPDGIYDVEAHRTYDVSTLAVGSAAVVVCHHRTVRVSGVAVRNGEFLPTSTGLALPCTHIIRSGQLQHAPAVQCGSRWLRWTFVRNRAT